MCSFSLKTLHTKFGSTPTRRSKAFGEENFGFIEKKLFESRNKILLMFSIQPDVTFANFKSTCNVRDVMFYTNPINEDISHPTHLSGITKVDSDEDSTVLIDRPSVG